MSLGLGFDTGGTYTDAVILDINTGTVLEKAKALTTKEDLVIGIENSIDKFDRELLTKVSIVSMSSTLATNSIVEGKGCRVGLICIGRELDSSIKIDNYIHINGRHDLNGKETEPLDIDAVKIFLNIVKDKVDCIAITGYMSVRNPEHEITIEKIIKETLNVPVVCGYQLSSSLGFNERAVTAVMNARLIPVIKDLIASIEKVMKRHSIVAPIMIVKGDGSIMNVSTAKERPVETILCGPAASLTGAKVLTNMKDALVVDMGGTTTDIGILRDGFPSINSHGAFINGHRTHVMAAEISTFGIGGDSRIFLNGKKISIKPQRIVPLCIAASKYPEIIDELKEALTYPISSHETFEERNVISDIEFFTASKPLSNEKISPADFELLTLIKQRPFTLNRAGSILNVQPLNFNIEKMEEHGLIQRIGLTPTDILHAEGTYVEYNARASAIGVDFMSKRAGQNKNEFIKMMKEMMYQKITRAILDKLLLEEIDDTHTNAIPEEIMNKIVAKIPGRDLECSITLNKPIIGIGAPVCAWLPNVAKRLNTDFIAPPNSMVGNAIGAVSGCIVESVEILIEPKNGSGTNSEFIAFSKLGRKIFETLDQCIEYAKTEGSAYVSEAAKNAGAYDISVNSDIKRRTYECEGTQTLLDIIATITATGKPRQML